MSIHFSSKSYEWETPQWLFDRYNKLYNFDLDVCATVENAKCKEFFTKGDDGLINHWWGNCWMNPPYGREIGKWMAKAYNSSLFKSEVLVNVSTVVCLVPARTDTGWWHDYAMKGKIEFLRGRIKFSNCDNPAPFPSAIVVFG